MDDMISRQAAIEKTEMLYRDAKDDTSYMLIGYNHALSDMRAILKSLPSAQPEITRCKDCRYNHDCNIQYHAQAGEEFYCGAAERRTDE